MIRIYDPNSLNPYGSELARVLRGSYRGVSLYSANDGAGYVIGSVGLAGPKPAGRFALINWALQRFADPVRYAFAALLDPKAVCILVWVRDPWQAAVHWLVSMFRPVVLIDHNPPGTRDSAGAPRWPTSWLRSSAFSLPVHGQEFAVINSPVIVHPSYAGMLNSINRSVANDVHRDRIKLAFIGAVRPDKGAEALAAICNEIDFPCELVLVGAERLPLGLEMNTEYVAIRLVQGPIGDEVLVRELDECDLVIAPYVQPTQSGSLILALSLGKSALAFSGGAILSVLGDGGLVEMNNVRQFVERIRDFDFLGDSPWLYSAEDLDRDCLESWKRILPNESA